MVVLVRITTDDGTWPDHDCIIEPEDWIELETRSTVAYSTSKVGAAVEQLEAAIRLGRFVEIASPPEHILGKMIEAGRKSAGMPPKAKRYLA
jgi:hypothetical protein